MASSILPVAVIAMGVQELPPLPHITFLLLIRRVKPIL